MRDFKVFVTCHNTLPLMKNFPSNYIPIQAGADTLGILSDTIGNSISERNWCYSELTAHYWIQQNLSYDIIGLMQYKKYLVDEEDKLLTTEFVGDVLSSFDIIVPKPFHFDCSNYMQYSNYHYKEDLDSSLNFALNFCSLTDIERVMKRTFLYAGLMFITTKSLFDEWIHWVMPILDWSYTTIDFSKYRNNSYQKRVIGFLAERLFNIWLEGKNLKIFTTKMMILGDNIYSKIME